MSTTFCAANPQKPKKTTNPTPTKKDGNLWNPRNPRNPRFKYEKTTLCLTFQVFLDTTGIESGFRVKWREPRLKGMKSQGLPVPAICPERQVCVGFEVWDKSCLPKSRTKVFATSTIDTQKRQKPTWRKQTNPNPTETTHQLIKLFKLKNS